jgi:hypothetical protein
MLIIFIHFMVEDTPMADDDQTHFHVNKHLSIYPQTDVSVFINFLLWLGGGFWRVIASDQPSLESFPSVSFHHGDTRDWLIFVMRHFFCFAMVDNFFCCEKKRKKTHSKESVRTNENLGLKISCWVNFTDKGHKRQHLEFHTRMHHQRHP